MTTPDPTPTRDEAVLSPCPFCGGTAKMWPMEEQDDRRYYRREVTCEDCDAALEATMPWSIFRTMPDEQASRELALAAAEKWNGRGSAKLESLADAEARVMQEYAWGNLTPLGVANHLKRAGFNIHAAQRKANSLASAPAPASGGVGAVATEPPYRPLEDFLDWAGGRWEVEVKNRPLNNVHRRALDTTWRQVIRKLGADPEALFGPAHDDLVEAQQASTAAPKLSLSDDDREIIASAIRSALSPAATPVSEAEPVYISRSTLRYLLDGMRLASVYVSKHPNMDDPVALYALSKPAGGDVVRCLATGNPVGTDTWQVGRPCRCANCSPLSQSTSAGRGGE